MTTKKRTTKKNANMKATVIMHPDDFDAEGDRTAEDWRSKRITMQLDMPATSVMRVLQHLKEDHVGNVHIEAAKKAGSEWMLDVSLTD